MGLFSFVKNADAKLKETADTKAAAETKKKDIKSTMMEGLLNSMDFGVEGLDIQVDGERVTVNGTVPSQEVREKIIVTLGNVEGIGEVEDNMELEGGDIAEPQFYTVERGDSLSKIAKQVYGDAMKYPVIFEANKPMLKDVNLIYPGQVLRIPPLEA